MGEKRSEKEIVASYIADYISENDFDLIGVGTGSTVDIVLDILKSKDNLKGLRAATSSYESSKKCLEAGIQVIPLNSVESVIPFGFDGADGVDSNLRLIKGKGAALFKEKILAKYLREFWIAVDSTKLVSSLAEIEIPIEVTPDGLFLVQSELQKLPNFEKLTLRQATGKHGAIITELGNFIIDVKFKSIDNDLEATIKNITGVIESGLFTNHASKVVAIEDGKLKILCR